MTDGSRNALRHLAYFSPLPPEPSGIADYSAELLPYLAELAQVTLFTTHPEQVADELAAFEVRSIADYGPNCTRYDVALYQMGNNMCHEELYRVLLRYPGVTVLHDHGLHHFMVARTIPQDDFVGYARALGYALGADGIELAYRVRHGPIEYPYSASPLNEQVLDHSLGVIVHSQYVKRRIQAVRPNLPVAVVPAPIQTTLGSLRSRAELGCPEDALVFASAGQVTSGKQVTVALEAFARLRVEFPHARYAVIGAEQPQDLDLRAWLQQHQLGRRSHLVWVSDGPSRFCLLDRGRRCAGQSALPYARRNLRGGIARHGGRPARGRIRPRLVRRVARQRLRQGRAE